MYYNSTKPIAYGFYQSVQKYPDNYAIYINERYYTYQELYNIVISVYHIIQDVDTASQNIAIIDRNDIFTYAALLAISLSGKTYVPLHEQFPAKRNGDYIDQANAGILLSSRKDVLLNDMIAHTKQKPVIRIIPCPPTGGSTESPARQHSLPTPKSKNKLAYIMFTSGSTGMPKGVGVSNYSVNHFFYIHHETDLFDFGPSDRFLQVYDLTFDVSVMSFFIPLNIGACCYVVPNSGNKYLAIAKMLEDFKISVVSMVPSVLNYLKPYFKEISFPHLRYSCFSGEALYHSIAKQWSLCIPKAKIFNFYGPTETTIYFTYYIWNVQQSARESLNDIVPMGIPFQDMEVLVADTQHQPVAPGEEGELYVHGPMCINSYLNNEHPEKFIQLGSGKDKKGYYKTGDSIKIVRGNLLFLGRTDNQVKINGFRVELSEIEHHLSKLTDNAANAAMVKKNAFGTMELFAFVEGMDFDTKNITAQLHKYLPAYMVPKKIFLLKQLPLNQNGKLDRLKLSNLLS